MIKLMDLYAKFNKGCEFFNREMASGGMTPYLRRNIDQFEREVMLPFDAACRAAKPQDLEMLGQ